jgi:hypothetical protein
MPIIGSSVYPRRAFLSGAAAALALLLPTASLAQISSAAPTASLYFRDVRVDTSPLAARGLPQFAAELAAIVRASARRIFADRMANNRWAPTLVLRIDSLSLAAGVGGRRHRRGGGGDRDFIEGIGLVVAANGRVLDERPLLTALPSSSAAAWYDPDSETLRLAALGEQFAQWLRRALGI